MIPRITFLGAASEVTGSAHLVQADNQSVLIDYGMFQGRSNESNEKNRSADVKATDLDAVIITHAHLDHIGRLPLLLRHGFRGRIYSTAATRELAELILLDAAKIQEQDAEYARRHGINDPTLTNPLYTSEEIPAVINTFTDVPYFRDQASPIILGRGIRFNLFDAGHILGSATLRMEIKNESDQLNIGFTGDLGRRGTPLLYDPEFFPLPVSHLITECTYGTRQHHPIEEVYGNLISVIAQAVEKSSKIIVPAFSLGRTQELIYFLHLLTDQGRIPRIPIYVDSPLSQRINDVFVRHQQEYDQETTTDFPNSDPPLSFGNLNFTHSVEESKALNELPGPMIIISASGMASGGRVTHHLKNALPDARNIILFTGYQADHTPGRRLIKGTPTLRLHGQDVLVKASIKVINDLSAHADSNDLLDFAEHCQGLRNLYLVHGETERATGYADIIHARHPTWRVNIPTSGQTFDLD